MPNPLALQGQQSLPGLSVEILGVSYEPGIGDVRESPALKLMDVLRQHGAELRYHDPHVPELRGLDLRSEPLPQLLDVVDLAIIVTAHPSVDHRAVDLRGITRHTREPNTARL